MTRALQVVISLGSNLGDRLGHLTAALEVIALQLPVDAVSPVYETEPIGGIAQPAYLNLVAFVTAADVESALRACHAAEDARGRLRARRWGPRTLDADVVSADAIRSDDPRLTLPHPRAAERAFVLAPWLDLDPDAVVPGRGRAADLLAAVGGTGVRRVDAVPRWRR